MVSPIFLLEAECTDLARYKIKWGTGNKVAGAINFYFGKGCHEGDIAEVIYRLPHERECFYRHEVIAREKMYGSARVRFLT